MSSFMMFIFYRQDYFCKLRNVSSMHIDHPHIIPIVSLYFGHESQAYSNYKVVGCTTNWSSEIHIEEIPIYRPHQPIYSS